MTVVSEFIYVVTTQSGDDERAFTNEEDAYSYKDWLQSLSRQYGTTLIKEMYLEDNS